MVDESDTVANLAVVTTTVQPILCKSGDMAEVLDFLSANLEFPQTVMKKGINSLRAPIHQFFDQFRGTAL